MKEKFDIIFRMDKEKDMQNWWEACNTEFMGVDWKQRVDKEIWKNIHGKSYNESKIFLNLYFKELYKNDTRLKMFKEEIPQYWQINKEEFIKGINSIIKKDIYPKRLICYFTSFPRGTKDKENKWIRPSFLKNKDGNITIKNYFRSIFHELIHIQVNHDGLLNKLNLSNLQKIDLNESLTVLINLYFYPKLIDKDWGYEQNKKLRQDLIKIWNKKQDIQNLVKDGERLIKQKYTELK
jgi:hypothetical protein